MPGTPRTRGFRVLLAALAVTVLALCAGAGTGFAADVPFPMVPKATAGTQCVDDPGFMRSNHMKLLTHQRDDTLRDGMRGGRYALQGCIDCHAVTDATGKAVSHESPQHFCVACHEYAAVQPDCFQCHTSLPSGAAGSQAQR
ncbi:Hdr-like menaquinol oxidoreductase cytochrome c subunit [Novispirillum sp. DQ9]|uniref:Hdr-like menaquinol oxidoreductase cytochrome c subunit n=1 Tax=Novispirillum sp. DQ9 TaxID=3398612 RepID=UPI003C7B0542